MIETAHRVGLPTTATIMFGHVETPAHWATHLLAMRDLAARTGMVREFVPLPFVHMEAPLAMKGRTRAGPSWGEVRLMLLDAEIDCDVLVCADDKVAGETVVALAREIGLGAFYAGVLANSVVAEALTSVLIALNQRYKVPGAGIRLTGIPRD